MEVDRAGFEPALRLTDFVGFVFNLTTVSLLALSSYKVYLVFAMCVRLNHCQYYARSKT